MIGVSCGGIWTHNLTMSSWYIRVHLNRSPKIKTYSNVFFFFYLQPIRNLSEATPWPAAFAGKSLRWPTLSNSSSTRCSPATRRTTGVPPKTEATAPRAASPTSTQLPGPEPGPTRRPSAGRRRHSSSPGVTASRRWRRESRRRRLTTTTTSSSRNWRRRRRQPPTAAARRRSSWLTLSRTPLYQVNTSCFILLYSNSQSCFKYKYVKSDDPSWKVKLKDLPFTRSC